MDPKKVLGNPQAKYTLLLGTPPEELTHTELAALMALTAQLTELSNLPGYDPLDVTLTLSFDRTGHSGCARLGLPEPKDNKP